MPKYLEITRHKTIFKNSAYLLQQCFLFHTLSNVYTAPATEETMVENIEASTTTGSDETATEGNTYISN